MRTPSDPLFPAPGKSSRGFTLIEMVFFIVIVGVALSGLVSVLASSMRGGADITNQKQALAIAEAIVEEIALKPFTYCDPDDPAVTVATGTGDCTAPAQAHEGTTRTDFDHVADYQRIASIASPVTDQSGTLAFPAGFAVSSLSVTPEALGAVPGTESLRISVTVTGPGSTSVTLDTYRTRYAPNLAD